MNHIKLWILIVHIFHLLLVFSVTFGFLLPNKFLIYHLVSWPLVWLHWNLNNDYCFLTQYERKLKNKISPHNKSDNKSNSEFMKKIFNNMGIYMSVEKILILTKILFTTSWLISAYRYF